MKNYRAFYSAVLFSFAIAVSADVPVVVLQPQSQTVVAGTNVTFKVTANDGMEPTLPIISSGTLKLWLKADTGVIISGGAVSEWQDQSPIGNHAFQTNANQRPIRVNGAVTGSTRPALRFDGIQNEAVGDFLQGTNDVGLSGGLTSFIVYSRTERTVEEQTVAMIGVPGTDDSVRGFYFRNVAVSNEMSFSGWRNDYGSGFSIPASAFRICTERLNASKTQIDFFDTDGFSNFQTSLSTSGLLSPGSGYYIGGLGSQLRHFEGDIAEIIYYQGNLTETDRQAIETYLKRKYFPTSINTPGLAFQWRFGGTNIAGATNSSLALANVQPSANGNYSVAVTNSTGTTLSSNAVLTVLLPVSIASHPQSVSASLESNVTFSVMAGGSAPFSYQWKFNGAPIPNATNSEFMIDAVQATNAGTYSVAVSNPVSSASSSNATLFIVVLPVITSQPQSVTAIAGTNVTFRVVAAGSEPIFPTLSSGILKLWLKADAGVISNGAGFVSEWLDQSGNANHASQPLAVKQPLLIQSAEIGGRPTLRFDGIQNATEGDFLRGTGAVGLTNGLTSFFVYSRSNRTILEQAVALVGIPGSFNSVRAFVVYGTEMGFSGWGNDHGSGFNIPASTYRVLTERLNANQTVIEYFDTDGKTNFTTTRNLGGLQAPGSGYYIGGLGSQTRNFAGDISELIYFQGTLSNSDRIAVETYLRQKYYQSISSADLSFQWKRDGTNIVGATNSSLTLTNVQPNAAGNYSVSITNLAGSITSSNATLTVLVPASITTHPQSQSVLPGANVTFSVTASGDSPLNYQWRFNGTNIVGATNSDLILTNVQLTTSGNYSVFVSNSVNSVVSSNAVLSVVALPVITRQPQDFVLLAGETATLSVGVGGFFPAVTSGNLRLWLKADEGVIKDSSNRVSQWIDQSGQGNNSFQTNLNRQPILAMASNGSPTIRFDGIQNSSNGDYLQGSNNVGIPDAFTSFFIYSRANRTILEQDPVLVGVPGANNSCRTYYIRSSGIPNEMAFGGWVNDYGSGFPISAETPRIWTFRMNTNKTQLQFFDVTGANSFTTNRTVSGLQPPGNGYFIGGLGQSLRNFQGDISEVIFYQGSLSDTDRVAVEDYLKQKHFEIGGSPAGSSTAAFQWRLNGTNIAGATNSSLALVNAQPGQSGIYSVIITNLSGSITSAPAVVKIRYLFPQANGQRLTNENYSYVGSANISFQSYFTNGIIFYTLDGSAPDFSSRSYTGPFALTRSATLRAIAYSSDFSLQGESDPVAITIIPTYSLSAATDGGGTISVDINGPQLSNTVVNVTANPSAGWTFLQWLGDAEGTNPMTAVTLTRKKKVEAVFGTTLNTTVAGSGAVFASPATTLYPYGTTVQLTAIPQPGNYFGVWGNAASGNTNPLDFVIVAPNRTVSSLFSSLNVGQHSLSISANGAGRATASPRANSYSTGQSVTLTATPEPGQLFTGWSGDASGVINPLTVTMNQSRSIIANFTSNPHLSLHLSPSTFDFEGFQLVLTGELGESYLLQKSTNLIDWSTVTTLTNSYGTAQFTDMPSTNSNEQFYRAVQPSP